MKNDKKEIESSVDEIVGQAIDRIDHVAAMYRQKVLIPICKKHKLTYIAGMGSTVFYLPNGNSIGDAETAKWMRKKALVPIFDVLNIEAIGRNDVFGFHIADISEEDLK